jgi:hypothetical protein
MGGRNSLQTYPERGAAQALDRSSDKKARQASKISEIRGALVDAGFDTLSKQAAALGVTRSTAWVMLRGNHKASGLCADTIKRILASPDLPPAARQIVQEYIQEKLLGAYGHSQTRLKIFRIQLGYPVTPWRSQ